jgi:hypothetical protein
MGRRGQVQHGVDGVEQVLDGCRPGQVAGHDLVASVNGSFVHEASRSPACASQQRKHAPPQHS